MPDTQTQSSLGTSYNTWLALQKGNEEVVRWSRYLERFPHLRKQTGHDHCCSVVFLATHFLILIRDDVDLDELMITRCFQLHDVPEGILKRDIVVGEKKDSDDVAEYEAFREHFSTLPREVWREMHKCYLLQFVLKWPKGLPGEALDVIEELSLANMAEALFFDGIQRLDYLYYAYECLKERGEELLMWQVSKNQVSELNQIEARLHGFGRVVWTPELREFFEAYTGPMPVMIPSSR